MLRELAATLAGLTATTQPGSWLRRGAQLLLAEAFITATRQARATARGPACR